MYRGGSVKSFRKNNICTTTYFYIKCSDMPQVKAQTHRTQLENRVSARRRLAELLEAQLPLHSRLQNLDGSACRKTAMWVCVGWEHCKFIRHIRLDPGTRNKSWVWKQRPGWNALCPQEQLTGVQADRKAKRIRNNKARRARRRRKKEEVPWRHWVGNSFFCHFQTHLAMQICSD